MRLPLGRILLIAFQAVWLNVVLPGHQRGMIVLPDFEAPCHSEHISSHPQCCDNKPGQPGDPSRKARCALCFFAARLTVPPMPLLAPQPLRLTDEIIIVNPESAPLSLFIASYYGRAPPVA